MLQRIQTLYLGVSIITYILLFLFPIAVYQQDVHTYKLFASGMKYMDPETFISFWATFPMLIILCILIILPLIAIFSYQKRRLQILFVNTGILLTIALIAMIFLFYSDYFFKDIVKVRPDYQFGAFIPLISLVFLVLAFRAIRKDEALVRSADRLR